MIAGDSLTVSCGLGSTTDEADRREEGMLQPSYRRVRRDITTLRIFADAPASSNHRAGALAPSLATLKYPAASATGVGSPVSRYVVLGEVGRGGMGRVLRAYDPKLQREVALKEVGGDRLGSAGAQRLVAEARAMAKLSHPHVVAVYDVENLASGGVILVMEYVPGSTLRGWLKAQRHWTKIVGRFVDAGRGLVAAHEAGLLHRDFKPANVLVSDAGIVKVTDFGLAKVSADASRSPSFVDDGGAENLTRSGTIMGTPRYMSPEQHRGAELTAASDQYAFCVALWEALCHAPPFSGPTIAQDKAEALPTWPNPCTPRPIVEAIVRGLSPRPRDRWPSMEALLEALAWDPSRRRNRWLLGLGGVGVLTLTGMSYTAWAQAPSKRCSGAADQLAGIWDGAGRWRFARRRWVPSTPTWPRHATTSLWSWPSRASPRRRRWSTALRWRCVRGRWARSTPRSL